jgi:hypothetical protein
MRGAETARGGRVHVGHLDTARERRKRRSRGVFKCFLVDETGDVQDPAGFLTAVPNWTVGETFLRAHDRRFRILEIRAELLPEMLDAGFNGIFTVEPA